MSSTKLQKIKTKLYNELQPDIEILQKKEIPNEEVLKIIDEMIVDEESFDKELQETERNSVYVSVPTLKFQEIRKELNNLKQCLEDDQNDFEYEYEDEGEEEGDSEDEDEN